MNASQDVLLGLARSGSPPAARSAGMLLSRRASPDNFAQLLGGRIRSRRAALRPAGGRPRLFRDKFLIFGRPAARQTCRRVGADGATSAVGSDKHRRRGMFRPAAAGVLARLARDRFAGAWRTRHRRVAASSPRTERARGEPRRRDAPRRESRAVRAPRQYLPGGRYVWYIRIKVDLALRSVPGIKGMPRY